MSTRIHFFLLLNELPNTKAALRTCAAGRCCGARLAAGGAAAAAVAVRAAQAVLPAHLREGPGPGALGDARRAAAGLAAWRDLPCGVLRKLPLMVDCRHWHNLHMC